MWSNFNPPRKDFLICTTQVDLGQEHSLGRGERPQAPVLGLPFAVLLKKSFIFPFLFQHGSPCESDLKSNFPLRSAPTWFSLSSAWAAPITCGKTVPNFSFKILAKVQFQKFVYAPASKSWPNFINCFDSVDWFYQLLPFLPLVLSQYLKAPWSYYSSLLDPTWWVVYRLYKYLVRILEFLCESHLLRLYIIGVFQPSECSVSDL